MPIARLVAVLLLTLAVAWPASAGTCRATDGASLAAAIAGGHAFPKHVVDEGQFRQGRMIDGRRFATPTIATRPDFAAFLGAILEDPTDSRRLANRRRAFWDESSGTVVIVNLGADDCGTAFRPWRGRTYYDGLR